MDIDGQIFQEPTEMFYPIRVEFIVHWYIKSSYGIQCISVHATSPFGVQKHELQSTIHSVPGSHCFSNVSSAELKTIK